MVSPVLRRVPSHEYRAPPTAVKDNTIGPVTSLISPSTPTVVETPSTTIGRITPTRRMLFDRSTARDAPSVSGRSSFESAESRQELEDLRRSCKKKDDQIKNLHQRFHTIQQGLGSIDQERSTLVEKAKKLEKEKRQIQRQLEIREQEILALVQRCASQEEKIRESARLRSQNRELAEALETIQRQSGDDDQERRDLQSLHQKLQESEDSREQLQERLRKVQREHDSIADTLQSCLAKIRQLTEEKEMIEEERHRERKRAEIEMERQRLAHVQVSNELKDDIENKQLKIEQMERILQENMFTKTSLRREKAISEGETQKMLASYEKKIADLQDELNRRSDVKDEGYKETLVLLQKKIEEKDALMEVLEQEFSGQMGELMKKQSSLDEAEEEKRSLETKVQKLERLECQYSALEEYVRILDSNLADLTNENAHLMLDKESLEEETQTLQRQLNELEAQRNHTPEQREEGEGYALQLTCAQKEELREQIEAALAEAQSESDHLQRELASSQRHVAQLEGKLSEARYAISQKEEDIQLLQQEKQNVASTLQTALTASTKEIAELQARLTRHDESMRTKASILHEEQAKRNQQEDHVRKLENSLMARSPSQDVIDAERRELCKQTAETNMLIESLQEQLYDIDEDVAKQGHCNNETKARKAELEHTLQKAQIHLRTLQEEIYSLTLANVAPGPLYGEIIDVESCSEDVSTSGGYQMQHLETELSDARAVLKEKQVHIDQLNADLEQTRMEKQYLLESLEEANENIQALQIELGGTPDEDTEKKLESALTALSNQINKTRQLEEEYSSAVKVTTQREVHNRQASSRIVILEKQITELRGTKAELKEKLRESDKVVASKDRQLQLFELESKEWKNRLNDIHRELDEEKNRRQSFEGQLSKKNEINTLIQSELDGHIKDRAKFEKRIKKLDQALLENHRARLEVEQKLTDSTTRIVSLEAEILEFRTMAKSLDDQLQVALKGLADKETFVRDTELKLAEKAIEFSQMEKEYEFATQSKQKTAERLAATEKRLASLEQTAASHMQAADGLKAVIEESSLKLTALQVDKTALEGEVEILKNQLSDSTKSSEERYELLESQHTKACNSLFEKQAQIDAMEADIQHGKAELDRVQQQLSDAKEAIELLTKDNSTREHRIQALLQQLDDVTKMQHESKVDFTESEEKRCALEKVLQQTLTKNEELMRELQESASRTQALDEKLKQSDAEKLAHLERADFSEKKCSELEDRINDLDQLIDSREAQLYASGNDLRAAQAALSGVKQESTNLKDVVATLETALTETTRRAKCVQEELEIHLGEERGRYDQASSKLADIQIMLSEQRQKASRYQDMVSEQDDKIDALTSALRETVTSKDTEFKSMQADLKNQIISLETALALKDDEIQELKVIELKDREEKIETLSNELKILKGKSQETEAALANEVNGTKLELDQLRAKMEEQEHQAAVSSKHYEEEISKMEDRIQELEDAKEKGEALLVDRDEKLRDRSNVISELTRREAELEKQEQVLLSSTEQLVKSERAVREDLERMKMALDVQILRSRESMDYQRQEMEARLRKERTEMSYKLRSIEIKLSEADNVLKERTSLLSEMVEHNRDLECRLERQQAQIDSMEEETLRCRAELTESQSELMHSREDLCKRENALTTKLNEERSHRDNAERELSKMKVQFKDAALAKKMISELEKDNKNLKDKVARQDAYLQRKLQQDKVQRGRVTPVSSSASASSNRTPVKGSSPQKAITHETPPRIVRPSPSKDPASAGRIPNVVHSQNSDSSRSSRSIASMKAIPRSKIQAPGFSSVSPTKMDSRNTSNTGRGSSATPMNDNNSFEPVQRDSWDLDVE